jgi:hypothetical protein
VRVYCSKSGREAIRRVDRDTGEEGYFATPPGAGKHEKVNARRFKTLEELGVFLIKHPEWKVYVGDAQIKTHIVVEGSIPLSLLRTI